MKNGNYKLKISGKHYNIIRNHLFPGDGNEAVAVCLCGRKETANTTYLLVNEVLVIPYEDCIDRRPDYLHWSTEIITPLLTKAAKYNYAVLKIHSHPGWYEDFSALDTRSDLDLFQSVYGWTDSDSPHASCIMLPNGRIFGRIIEPDMRFWRIAYINVVGDDLRFWQYGLDKETEGNGEIDIRTAQVFGEATVEIISKLTCAVIGCSGTGSIVAELLYRLGVRKIIPVDPDIVELKNLNRVLSTSIKDAVKKRKKVNVFASAAKRAGLRTEVEPISTNLASITAIQSVSEADVIFSCVDGAEGRHLANLISSYYLIPLIDVGIRIESDKKGGISHIVGSVHYVQPSGSSLLSRRQYNLEEVRAEGMKRVNPEMYARDKRNKYVVDVDIESPAVISVNTLFASMAVNELLARLHSFRYDPNATFATKRMSLTDEFLFVEKEGDPCAFFTKLAGMGDVNPLLGSPEFSLKPSSALTGLDKK